MKTKSEESSYNKRNYFVTLAIMTVLAVLFWRSLYFTDKTATAIKILDVFVVFVLVIVLPILFVKVRSLNSFVTSVIESFPRAIKQLKTDLKEVIIWIAAYGITIAVIVAGNCLYDHKVRATYSNWNRILLFVAIALIIGVLIKYRNECYEKAHIVFALIALILGLLFIIISPAGVGLSWDDQIHYGRTLIISSVFDGTLYEADAYQVFYRPITGLLTKGALVDYENGINAYYQSRTLVDGLDLGVDSVGAFNVSYVPCAIGIIIGRGLGLSYVSVFNLGRAFNLFFYVLIMALGIKRLNRGKILMAAFALTPTIVFLAGTYHYDSWINALICCGYCHYIAAYQDNAHGRSVKQKDLIIAAVMIVLGCIPKAVYCPLLIPLFFVPKSFLGEQRKRYYIAISSLLAIILVIFAFPYLASSAWLSGDQRFGGEVNSGSQIAFILQNPLQYMKILFDFCKMYVDPSYFSSWANFFAYLGMGPISGLWWCVLLVLAFIDRDENQNKDLLARVIGIIMIVGALVLIVTALYVSISEIGSSEIRGVQPRYLFPLLLPLFWFAIRPRTTNASQNKMAIFSFVIMSALFLSTIHQTLVLPY